MHREHDHTKLEEWERRNDAFDRVAKVEYLFHARVHVHELDEEGKKDYVWADLDTILADRARGRHGPRGALGPDPGVREARAGGAGGGVPYVCA